MEIADIFNEYSQQYIQKYHPPLEQLKVIKAIISCRTKALGLHSYACRDCGNILQIYHSCRNRHCPKCQYQARKKWLVEREKELLPVKYFHLIFTVPAVLNPIGLFNKKIFYEILFSSVNYTLSVFASDNKWMGGQYGALAILHSWGQKMTFHPHTHLAMPAGGISEDRQEWRSTRNHFFAPVKLMSDTFRDKFCSLLQECLCEYNLSKSDKEKFNSLLSKAKIKKWVVFAQKPFSKPQYLIDYLANYTHRVAISNSRLIKLENGDVYFYYKDYHKDGQWRMTKLAVIEFIRRFLQHALPYGFRKIRYFGFMANRFKEENLANAYDCLKREGCADITIRKEVSKELERIKHELSLIMGIAICPCCGGEMVSLNVVTENVALMLEDSS